MPGPALRALVADARSRRPALILLGHDRLHAARCSESNTRAGPVIDGFFRPVILATQPSGARLPLQDREVALRVHRLATRAGSRPGRRAARPARPSASRPCVLPVIVMQSPCSSAVLEQHLQHLRHAAGAVEVDRDVAARGLEVAQHRHLLAHALEVVDGPLHARRRWRSPGSAARRWSSRRSP